MDLDKNKGPFKLICKAKAKSSSATTTNHISNLNEREIVQLESGGLVEDDSVLPILMGSPQ